MQSIGKKLKILYLCTGNSCRSQMAEGWTRYLKSETIDAYSAGVEPHGIDPRAVKVMAEVGIESTQFLLFRCRKGDDELLVCPTCTHASLHAQAGEARH